MTDKANHPDYELAPEMHRWGRPLAELTEVLRKGAYAAKGDWCWYVMPRGALVAMRVPPTFRKELRIARRLRKAPTEKSSKLWYDEVQVFLRELGLQSWVCTTDVLEGSPTEEGIAAKVEVIYTEPAPLGSKAEKCAKCGEPAEKGPYKEPICQDCATKAGREEADTNNQRRLRVVR